MGNIEQGKVALNARGNTGGRNNITTRATGKWWERTERNRDGGVYGCTLADGVGSWTAADDISTTGIVNKKMTHNNR